MNSRINDSNNDNDSQQQVNEVAAIGREVEAGQAVEREEVLSEVGKGESQAGNDQEADVQSGEGQVADMAPAAKEAKAKNETLFSDLGLSQFVLEAIEKSGYRNPTDIQAATIPLVLSGEDVLGQAQTGTGKTAAFALPLLEKIDTKKRYPQILVLAPTRELAMQVADSFRQYGSKIRKLKILSIFGGASYQNQIRALDSGVQIVVGTPGRVMDHMRQGTLDISRINTLVLDEADEMLRMGFIEDVEFVLSHAPEQRQMALFSATMPGPIRKIADRYLNDPKVVKIAKKRPTADTVEQQYVVTHPRNKFEAFSRILEVEATDGVIVFVKTKIDSMEVAEKLCAQGLKASPLNGDMVQSLRQRTVEQLKSGQLDILVATDVAARGLDVQRISHVFNYDFPFDSEIYVHRIGRTGRAGRTGKAILLASPRETRAIRGLQRDLKAEITEVELPSVEAINGQRVAKFQKKVLENIDSPAAMEFQPVVKELMEQSGLDPVALAASIAAIAQGDKPLFAKPIEKRVRVDRDRQKGRSRSNEDFQRFRVGVGRRGGISPKNLVGAIAGESTFLTGKDIGQIDIFDTYSTVDLPSGMEAEILQEMEGVFVSGKPMNLTVSTDRDRDRRRSRFSGPKRPGGSGRKRRSNASDDGGFVPRGSGRGSFGKKGGGGRPGGPKKKFRKGKKFDN